MAEPVRDQDLWPTRIASFASLVQADALAVVLLLPNGRTVSYAAHNLDTQHLWLTGPLQQTVVDAVSRNTPVRTEVAVTLADGRTAHALLCSPITWNNRAVGAIAALRANFIFELDEVPILATVARLTGVDLATSNLLQRARQDDRLQRALEDRRHAMTLYELARLSAGRASTTGEIEVAAVLGDSLDCDVVGIWTDVGEGILLRGESYGYADGAPRRISADHTLTRVLREGTTERIVRSAAPPVWLAAATEGMVVPLGNDSVLVIGRRDSGFTPAELHLAPSLAEAIELGRPSLLVLPETTPAPADNWRSQPAPEAALEAVTDASDIAQDEIEAPAPVATSAQSRRSRRGWALALLIAGLLLGGAGLTLATPGLLGAAGVLVFLALAVLAF